MNTQSRNLLILTVILVALIAIMAGCTQADVAPRPESDRGQNFNTGCAEDDPTCTGNVQIPVDDGVYRIKGKVVGDVNSLTRQIQAARGSLAGSQYFVSGSFYGPEMGGKGFIRLHVQESDSYLAPVGTVVIVKSTDTKGIALLPGDVVTLKCRHQYEAVAAVRNKETFDEVKLETWELDYCRLVTPVIQPAVLGE